MHETLLFIIINFFYLFVINSISNDLVAFGIVGHSSCKLRSSTCSCILAVCSVFTKHPIYNYVT